MPEPPGPDTGTLVDERGHRATAEIIDGDDCRRSYRMTTDQPLRDGEPENPRVVEERAGAPTLRSGHLLFDALYALAREEVRQLSVDAVRDAAFNRGAATDCGSGGCFETGRLWNYVWTRDTAYAAHLGLAAADPVRARNSLVFKLAERRGGGDLQVVQDTGSGGSYPVSTDRVVWALGARAVLAQLRGQERERFRDRALEALTNTIEHDRRIVWDPRDGLYRGEQSFLDWREQSYPPWTSDDTVHIAMSKALSTNILHLVALETAGELAAEVERHELAARYRQWSTDLRAAIRKRLWLEADGQFSSFTTTELDPAPTRRYDLLGASLAILHGIASPEQARRMLSSYPHYGPGAPVIWPQQPGIPVYHNRGEWPFVTAYWLRAAARAGHDAVADRMVMALVRGSAMNLSNMENFEAASGLPWVDEGDTSGPVINSQRQLWSVAGYLSMVEHTLFGLHPEARGLRIAPYLTGGLRNGLFAGSEQLVLDGYPYQGSRITVVLQLPPQDARAGAGSYRLGRMTLDGRAHEPLLRPNELDGVHRVEIWLEADPSAGAAALSEVPADERHRIFAPPPPRITGIGESSRGPTLELSWHEDEQRDRASGPVTLSIYRDGQRVASGLPATQRQWTDTATDRDRPSHCYAVEASYPSGNHSQHSEPRCWWRKGFRRLVFPASKLKRRGGTLSDDHGRSHVADWGDPGDRLRASGIEVKRSGPYLVRAIHGNGAGPINTGITCAIAKLTITDEGSGEGAGTGVLVMPHLGRWDRWGSSSFAAVELEAGKRYSITIEADPDYANMSAFEHFAAYTAGKGGADGRYNRANIAALELWPR